MDKVNADESGAFEIPEAFHSFLDAAIIAFERSYPRARVLIDGHFVTFSEAPANGRREFLHFLYREKIYQETLDLRRTLYARVRI